MIVYNPKEKYGVLKLFPIFVDFLIQQLNSDKIEITKTILRECCGFEILLVRSNDYSKQTYIVFEHAKMRGWESQTPIERFEFTLCQGGIVQAQFLSQNPNEYDKMLELFTACLSYLKRHAPERHKYILERIDLSSLERKNWKKSKEEIVKELSEDWEMRKAIEDFERMKKQALANLISKYAGQGYEITE